MVKVLYLFCVIPCLIGLCLGSLCESNHTFEHAFNIGYNVFIDNNWSFASRNKSLINKKYQINQLFTKIPFQLITTGFSFIFDDCTANNMSKYCQTTSKVKNVLIVIGRSSNKIVYASYYYNNDHIDDLSLVENIELPWNLNTTGNLTSHFWIPSTTYESMVFVPTRNELLATTYNQTTGTKNLYSRKLDRKAFWYFKWKFETDIGFRGMFHIDNRVFALDNSNGIFEFKWLENNTIQFKRISNAKDFFDCNQNSVLIKRMTRITPSTYTTKITTSKHTTIHDLTSQTTNESILNNTYSTKAQNATIKPKVIVWIIIATVVILLIALIISFVFLCVYWRKTKKKLDKRITLKQRTDNARMDD